MSRTAPFLSPLAALFAMCAAGTAGLAADAPLIAVSVTRPLTEHITTWDEYSGRFVAVKSVEVRPRVSGFIDKVNFVDGATVKAGDLLFTIDQRPFAIAVESAKAEVARAEAQVKLTAADVERAKPLLGTNAISGRDYDQRAAGLAVAQAQLQVARPRRRRPSSISNGPRSKRRSPAASPTRRSTRATWSTAAPEARRFLRRSSPSIPSSSCSRFPRATTSATRAPIFPAPDAPPARSAIPCVSASPTRRIGRMHMSARWISSTTSSMRARARSAAAP